jgi:biotin carboxyl carrier protein
MGHLDVPPMVIEPPEVPLAPVPPTVGQGLLGGVAAAPVGRGGGTPATEPGSERSLGDVLVDGALVQAGVERLDDVRIALRVDGPDAGAPIDHGAAPGTTRVLLGPPEGDAGDGRGATRREVVVDGWRVELEIESERRAALRDRARRGRAEAAQGGPSEVRAIIPGRVVSVSVVPGDPVVASQQLLVVEAMKMQNELRAPRDGTVTRVAVGAGENIEVGDLLLVLE